MIERILLQKDTYFDSAFLMRIARDVRALPGIAEAVVLMGTEMNRGLIAEAGFTAAVPACSALDVLIALRGADERALDAAERETRRRLSGEEVTAARDASAVRLRTVHEAVQAHPDVNLVSVSVPGPYAAFVAHRALDEQRHVFLFSNNVSLEDEIALKRRARESGLLVMGPDCGTAIIAGVGLGFSNRVPRGAVGIVGASGTGMQEVCCAVAREGQGVSHAVGTGSRDLSRDVGGLMTELALRLLAADEDTRAIVLVAKHPHESVAARLHGLMLETGKPCVVRYLGQAARPGERNVRYAGSLDEAAHDAAALASGAEPGAFVLHVPGSSGAPATGRLVGLFGGGSLAAEARLVLESRGIRTEMPEHPLGRDDLGGTANLVIDTGEDFYTVGRPHPMIDQSVRCNLVRTLGAHASTGVLLLDLVLGDGSHPNPAPEIAQAVADARRERGRLPLPVVCSVCGCDADPQGAARQCAVLTEAGINVEPTAARAALVAAALMKGEV